jgi:hypothetical protein
MGINLGAIASIAALTPGSSIAPRSMGLTPNQFILARSTFNIWKPLEP